MREHESISSLKLFNGCPRCYWLKYVAGLEKESSPAQLLGSEVHKGIEFYHTSGKEPLELNLTPLAGKLVGVYMENVPASMCNVVETKFLIPFENIITGEVLPMKFKGIIDGVNEVIEWLFEHKTSKNYWKCDDIATNIQATGYAYAYFYLYGKLPKGIRFNILKKNKITMKYQPLETYRTLEDLVYFFNWAKKTVDEIATSEFEPRLTRFNNHHPACPYAGG